MCGDNVGVRVVGGVLNGTEIVDFIFLRHNNDTAGMLTCGAFDTDTIGYDPVNLGTRQADSFFFKELHNVSVCCFIGKSSDSTCSKYVFGTEQFLGIFMHLSLHLSREVKVDIRRLISVESKEGLERDMMTVGVHLGSALGTIHGKPPGVVFRIVFFPGGVVLHIAVDGVEVFKLYLTYRISDNMQSVINELSLAKTRIVMRTVDPNINLELVLRLLTSTFDGKLTLVRKPFDENTEAASERDDSTVEGGVLVNGEVTEAILDVVKACKLYGAYSKLNFHTSIILFGAGALLSVFLGIIGALAGISSLYIVLFQIISIIPSVILSNLILK